MYLCVSMKSTQKDLNKKKHPTPDSALIFVLSRKLLGRSRTAPFL